MANPAASTPASLGRAPRTSIAPAAVRNSKLRNGEALPRISLRKRMFGGPFPEVLGGADALLYGAVVALIVLGVVMVYSASSVRAVRMYGDGHYFLIRQAIYAAIGLPLLIGLARVDYHRYRPLSKIGLVVAFALLLFVALGFGHSAGGAARWIHLGPINVQPAEVAKVAMILWLADSLAAKVAHIRSFSVGFLPHVLTAGLLVLLCMKQPDFGSAVVLVILTFVLLFAAGAKIGYMLAGLALALPIAFAALRFEDYRWRRIIAFLDPVKYRREGGYQIVESWVSFSAGGPWGVGLGDSRQKLLFLPEAHTDFIAAIVAEELGYVGFALLVLAFAIIVVRGARAALRAVDDYGTYLAVGLTMFIGVQALTNLAVVLGLLPTKGLTLPFLSFGGSSLLVNCAAVGILLNVSRPRRAPPEEPAVASLAARASDNRRMRPKQAAVKADA